MSNSVSTLNTGLPTHRPIRTIALDIYTDWLKVNPAARPYLDAMLDLDQITSTYGLDSASNIVSYFLANASNWRGESARALKKELNDILKLLKTNERLQEIANQNGRRVYGSN